MRNHPNPLLEKITPTPFLQGPETALEQRLDLTISNPGAVREINLRIETGGQSLEITLGTIPTGRTTREVFLPALPQPRTETYILSAGESSSQPQRLIRQPARRWTVHLVQTSHHDLGYTGLPSQILRLHDRHLSEALDFARTTDSYPDEAQFRIVIEQAWSLEHFLETAPAEKAAEMVARLRSGRFEVNALFGNLTTELCSHEELLRALYPVARLQRQYGVPVTSAEHNDITGFCWGLAETLLGAGIRLFIPGLPLYYNWGHTGLQSFWDQETILSGKGPGAFRWQSPSGKDMLVWCNGSGCGGDPRASLPGFMETLLRLDREGYPFHTLRWPVIGANSDNAPYRGDFSETVRDWNTRWTFPRLVFSTNARFHADFIHEDISSLKVFRGELPGQDYPVGAASTAAATGVNRRTHAALSSAETAATAAAILRDGQYPRTDLDKAWREVILHDEHTWGFQFPAGPASDAAKVEKAARAYRAAGLAHDVSSKALSALGGAEEDNPCVLVFNSLGESYDGLVRMPLRPLDNIQRVLTPVPADTPSESYRRVTSLPGRDHLILPPELLNGGFDLVDASTGESIPYQIEELRSPEEPFPYSADRYGLGNGTRRMGLFEVPAALKMDLVFMANDVPACGYKTYQLKARTIHPRFPQLLRQTATSIENEYYRITADRSGLVSLYDKEARRELVDPAAPHRMGALVVRGAEGSEWVSRQRSIHKGSGGPVCVSLDLKAEAHGHPRVFQRITLARDQKQIDLAAYVLKDCTPLLDAHLAFPFDIAGADIRYEGVLSCLSPVEDFLPGSQSDRLAVQNWVKMSNQETSLIWATLDAPVASLGDLWEGYVSPAHRCRVPESISNHHRLIKDDLKRAWIYSLLFSNNFGTNFAVSQSGYALFRYRFSTRKGSLTDQQAAAWGQAAMTQPETALIPGLPARSSTSLLRVEGARLLAFKRAENDDGWIVRLWNPGASTHTCRMAFPDLAVSAVCHTDLVEANVENPNPVSGDYQLDIPGAEVVTLRLRLENPPAIPR